MKRTYSVETELESGEGGQPMISRPGMQRKDMSPEQPNSQAADDLSCNEDYWSSIVDEEPPESKMGARDPKILLELEELDKESWLHMLLSKERETHPKLCSCYLQADLSLISSARQEPLKWILAVNSYHAFSSFTAVLSVNYLDRFLLGLQFWRDRPMKPWMLQLAAVACLSLAAKVAETHVPLLLDLQVISKPL
jgi:cyclin D3